MNSLNVRFLIFLWLRQRSCSLLAIAFVIVIVVSSFLKKALILVWNPTKWMISYHLKIALQVFSSALQVWASLFYHLRRIDYCARFSRLYNNFNINWSQRKILQVYASFCKSLQVFASLSKCDSYQSNHIYTELCKCV